jgi:hypothetical protein
MQRSSKGGADYRQARTGKNTAKHRQLRQLRRFRAGFQSISAMNGHWLDA